ncbi:MAG: hypothetical protein ACI85I_001717 [Arenicella sp.]|jgi:hypothetical protein
MMCSFVMFSLKYPSLLQLEQCSAMESRNIENIYQISRISSNTQMRSIHSQLSSFFSSSSVYCPCCLSKSHANGKVTYFHQMLCGEPVSQQNSVCKNDCELNPSKRLLSTFPCPLPANECLTLCQEPHLGQILLLGSHFMCCIKAVSNLTA